MIWKASSRETSPFELGSVEMMIIFLILLVFFKVVAMTLTFSAGGVGGVFAPTLFAGGLSGYAFAMLFNYSGISDYHLSTENYALTAMAGTIAGVFACTPYSSFYDS